VRNPTSIQDNIGGGVRYLASLNDLFHGDLRMVVAAYYCGEHHILTSGLRYHNVEVIAYVTSVESRYEHEVQLYHSGSLKEQINDLPHPDSNFNYSCIRHSHRSEPAAKFPTDGFRCHRLESCRD